MCALNTAAPSPWRRIGHDGRMAGTDETTLIDVLANALSSGALKALAGSLDLDAADVQKLVQAVVPVLVERLQANASSGGAEGLASALRDDHDGSVVDAVVPFLSGGFRGGPGVAILGHVFGDELDDAVANVATTTGLPPTAVRLGFNALAPLVLGAITKVAIGAVTAVVVVKLLDIAVDNIRSGRAQRLLGRLNDRLDADNDGNAADDVARTAARGAKAAGSGFLDIAGRVRDNQRVRSIAAKAAASTPKLAVSGAKAAASTGKKLLKRLWR
jgi:hypothetical protein